jgi:hypothetical protein
MFEEELNKKGFELLTLLDVKVINNLGKPRILHEKMIGIGEPIKLDNIITGAITYRKDGFNNKIDVYKELQGKTIGFNEITYEHLKTLADEVSQLDFFSKFTDLKFVETKIFEWVVDVYVNNQADYNLLNYLKVKVEAELHNYVYYFKVYSIGIFDEIQIGKVQFTALTQDFFKKSFSNLKKESFDQMEPLFGEYIRSVVAISHGYGTKDKAFSIAHYNVLTSLNALKCCLIEDSLRLTHTFPHLREIPSEKMSMSFMYKFDTENGRLHFKNTFDNIPIEVDSYKLNNLGNNGLLDISNYLKKVGNSILDIEIINRITLLGDAVSNRNLYERIVKLITFFESFIIPENSHGKGKGSGKGQTYIKNVIKYLNVPDELRMSETITRIYVIRDRYLHNKIELRVDIIHLIKFQEFSLNFILMLIRLRTRFSTVDEVLEELEIGRRT